MNPAATPTPQLPELAARLGRILVDLGAVVAARFLHNPRLVLLTIPLWTRLGRAARRFAHLAGLFAAGNLPARCHSGPSGRSRLAPIPRQKGWLIAAIGYHAVGHASQLAHVLAEPAMAEFLAASPAAARLLRPLCRMLALPPPGPAPKPAPIPAPKPTPPAPPAQPATPRRAASRISVLLAPRPVPPLCPRLADRWPWVTLATANPA